jgi:hypothetical protein
MYLCSELFSRQTVALLILSLQPPAPSWFLARGFCYPEDGGDTFIRNIGSRRYTRCHNTEYGILHSHRRENLKSYILRILILSTMFFSSLQISNMHVDGTRHGNTVYLTPYLFVRLEHEHTPCSSHSIYVRTHDNRWRYSDPCFAVSGGTNKGRGESGYIPWGNYPCSRSYVRPGLICDSHLRFTMPSCSLMVYDNVLAKLAEILSIKLQKK